jgi:hypothetical protein
MLKEIPQSDITIRPFKVYKEFSLTEEDIVPVFGKNITASLFDADTDEQSNGIYKRLLYRSVKEQFYRNSATASILTEVGNRRSYASTDERNLEDEIAVIAIPQQKYGEGVKVGSVRLMDGGSEYIDDTYSNLVSGSQIWGNIFYDRGLVVLTKDVVSGSTLSDFQLDYRSTNTIYENEVFFSVLENEFNVSQNPTAVDDGLYIKFNTFTSSVDSTKFGGFADYDASSSIDPTGSYLAPYITTIGLYDNDNQMVAVAKLPRPIKSLPDYPVNFIIRVDT